MIQIGKFDRERNKLLFIIPCTSSNITNVHAEWLFHRRSSKMLLPKQCFENTVFFSASCAIKHLTFAVNYKPPNDNKKHERTVLVTKNSNNHWFLCMHEL